MNLVLPTPTVTLGPDWAEEINAAFQRVDEHDHSSGKGTKVTAAGLNLNGSLDLQNFKIYNQGSVQFTNLSSALSGAANAASLSVAGGNLYYVNASGISIQLTSGGAIVSTPSAVDSFVVTSVSTNLVIGPSDTFTYLLVDTTSPRSITLPLVSAVSSGRVYIIKDISGQVNTNNITLGVSGSDTIDGASSYIIDSNYSATWVISNGATGWFIS